jgi:pimeloyl-ACP methyl ester carboxylesterase
VKKRPSHVDDLRGASRLAIDATRGVTDLVEAMHRTVASGPAVLGRPLEGLARLATGVVYGSVRGVTGLVGAGIDLALAQLAPLLGESAPWAERDEVLAVLNGVLGDYLVETKNPLALSMQLCHDGAPLSLDGESLRAALPAASGRLVLLLHGSSMSDRGWRRNGHDHGAQLSRDLGVAPVYVRYNSGLHVSENGRELAGLVEKLVAAWPVSVDEIAFVGHSMGGLVARAACHVAEEEGHAWRAKLRHLVTLGTPHHGAPLERAGHWVDVLLGVSRYSAPFGRLARIRSAGVTDLRYGNVLDEHWQDRDRFASHGDGRRELRLPDGVACYAIAATTAPGPGDRLPGDGLVPVASALGQHERPSLTLNFPPERRFVAHGTGHLDLLERAEVYAQLRAWLAPDGK